MKFLKKPVYIIAEAGVNHNGDMQKAKKMIEIAKSASVDAIKFQSFNADKLVSRKAKKALYQSNNMLDNDEFQYSMLKSLELSNADHHFLIEECKKNEITFLSTAFDTDGVDYLDKLGMPIFKIPSGEITNFPYLVRVASKGKPVILSTGMANIHEIREAIEVLKNNMVQLEEITVLHCNTEYPTPFNDVNLRAMIWIGEQLNVNIGYSDHTLGLEVPIAAITMGACIIEKHFTLDRSLPGPDHKASIEPNELQKMVKSIRNVELALSGDGIKKPTQSEIKNIEIARKSIHTNKSLNIGHILTEDDLIPLRPANGISPMKWNDIIGKKMIKPTKEFELLTWDMLE